MSWAEHHRQSELYASSAELADKQGKSDRAIELYRLAAEAENMALNVLDPSKARTLGITVVSTAALWYKAGDFQKTEQFSEQWLVNHALPAFAIDQLRDLVQQSHENFSNKIIPSTAENLIPKETSPNKKAIIRKKFSDLILKSTTLEELNSLAQEIVQSPKDDFCSLAKFIGLNPLTDFIGSDLSNTQLMGIDLSGALLNKSNLSSANLSKTNLTNANLSGAYLVNADLSFTVLNGVNLKNASLEHAKLLHANLMGADLCDANLSFTDLNYANLNGAKVTNASFGYSVGILPSMKDCLIEHGADFGYYFDYDEDKMQGEDELYDEMYDEYEF